MLTIFSTKITERLKYTLSIIFDDRGIKWKLTDDENDFQNAPTPKLNYASNKKIEGIFTISPTSLLFKNEISNQQIEKTKWNDIEVLSFDGQPDILASIFYVISLYDDYLQTEKDKHNRNIGEKSLLFRMNYLEQLVVERWSEHLISVIEKENNCTLNSIQIPFKTIPTFDIDNAYSYQLKGGWRKYLSIGKDILKNNNLRLVERRMVLKGTIKDPYDTYKMIEDISNKGFDVKVFWLLGNYGKFDKNIQHTNEKQRELIQRTDRYAHVGLHPSYHSNQKKKLVKIEKKRLENILNRSVTHTRQHFLKVKLPDTFIQLENAGFTDDYSLGYADKVGFRAGIARPFLWFNLQENKISKLTLHPITYMDGTLNEYMKLPIEKAIEIVQKLKTEIQTYGGEFIPLWHNETIGNYKSWKEWDEVLEVSLEK